MKHGRLESPLGFYPSFGPNPNDSRTAGRTNAAPVNHHPPLTGRDTLAGSANAHGCRTGPPNREEPARITLPANQPGWFRRDPQEPRAIYGNRRATQQPPMNTAPVSRWTAFRIGQRWLAIGGESHAAQTRSRSIVLNRGPLQWCRRKPRVPRPTDEPHYLAMTGPKPPLARPRQPRQSPYDARDAERRPRKRFARSKMAPASVRPIANPAAFFSEQPVSLVSPRGESENNAAGPNSRP